MNPYGICFRMWGIVILSQVRVAKMSGFKTVVFLKNLCRLIFYADKMLNVHKLLSEQFGSRNLVWKLQRHEVRKPTKGDYLLDLFQSTTVICHCSM